MKAIDIFKMLQEADTDEGEIKRHLDQVVPYLMKPLERQKVGELTAQGQHMLEVNILISLAELINYDLDWLNNRVSQMITGDESALEEIYYLPVGVEGEGVILRVTASVQEWLMRV